MGIGTASPQRMLHIVSPDNAADIWFTGATDTGGTVQGLIGIAHTNGALYESLQLGTESNHPLYLSVNGGVHKMIFNTSGYLGLDRNIDNISYPIHLISGAYVSVGGTWTNASSRQYKNNITELSTDDAIDALNGLTPVRFTYKKDKSESHVGFISEDVPQLVATKDRKGLSPMDITAVLTKVVQQQQDQLKQQQEMLNRQQAELIKLNQKIESMSHEAVRTER